MIGAAESPPPATRALAALSAGLVTGLVSAVLAAGNAGLLASGALAPHLGTMMAVTLVAAGILPIVAAFLSTIPGQVTAAQEMPIVAMAGVTAATVAAYAGPREGPAFLATVLAAIGLTTTLCGVSMILLGRWRLGRIVRFVPYPVFGGFLAITGWYLLAAGFEIVVRRPEPLPLPAGIAEPATLVKLALAVGFVAALRAAEARVRSVFVLPAVILAAVAAFNLALPWLDRDVLARTGWAIPAVAEGGIWPPVTLADLSAIDWRAVLGGLVLAPIVIVATAASAIMNVSAIELRTDGDVDLDRELAAIGTGNVVAGLAGGTPGFPSVSGTVMAAKLGGAGPATGIIKGLCAFAGLAFAPRLIEAVPAPLLGALLAWLGVGLLVEWVVRPVRTMGRAEYAIILVILAVSIVAGFPAGILTGLVAAVGQFALEYSRVGTTRYVADARDYHAELMPPGQRDLLKRHGSAIVIVKVAGYVFFGTGDSLVREVVERVAAPGPDPVRFAIIDFRRVSGIDSSAAMSFLRLRRIARHRGFVIVLAGQSAAIRERLAAGGLDLEADPLVHVEPDLDSALRWTAGRLPAAVGAEPGAAPDVAGAAIGRLLGDPAFAPYLDRIAFPAGARMIEQGARSDDIYFVEAGEGRVQLEPSDGPTVKLAEFGPGSILGEIAFYCGEQRTASVIARTPVTALRLSRAALDRLDAERPALAARLHREMAYLLSDRLRSANRLIRVLAD